jgi:hypothetical protein
VASADTLIGYASGAILGAIIVAFLHTRLFGPEPKAP